MPLTQRQIADHLFMDPADTNRWLAQKGFDWRLMTLDEVREAYVKGLRARLSGHESAGGVSLVDACTKTELLQQEMLEMTIAERRGDLIPVDELEPALTRVFATFRQNLLSLGDRLKTDIDALYGINFDPTVIDVEIERELTELSRYDLQGN